MKPMTRSLIFIFSLVISAQIQAAPPQDYPFLPLDKALNQAASEAKPVLLYFGRYGCTTCRKMHAEVFTDEQLKAGLNRDFVLAYVDTESGKRIRLPNGERTTEMQFAARNRILGTPTFVFFSNEQQPLFRKAGFQTIAQMNLYREFVAGGHYLTQTLKQFSALQ